ncbi:MAG: hypothetical protein WBQ73_00965 [Candidatus Babeliales bacterium]
MRHFIIGIVSIVMLIPVQRAARSVQDLTIDDIALCLDEALKKNNVEYIAEDETILYSMAQEIIKNPRTNQSVDETKDVLNTFAQMLYHFANIIAHPKDAHVVVANVTRMIAGIITIALQTRSPYLPTPSEKFLKKLILDVTQDSQKRLQLQKLMNQTIKKIRSIILNTEAQLLQTNQ